MARVVREVTLVRISLAVDVECFEPADAHKHGKTRPPHSTTSRTARTAGPVPLLDQFSHSAPTGELAPRYGPRDCAASCELNFHYGAPNHSDARWRGATSSPRRIPMLLHLPRVGWRAEENRRKVKPRQPPPPPPPVRGGGGGGGETNANLQSVARGPECAHSPTYRVAKIGSGLSGARR